MGRRRELAIANFWGQLDADAVGRAGKSIVDGLRAEIDERERAVDDAFAGRGEARPGNPS